LYILMRPNPRSWLTRGTWILLGFGAVLAIWIGAVWTGRFDVIAFLAIPLAVLALATAGYSALLFAQAEGRAFWQSPLVLPHLVVSAMTAGAAVALLMMPPSAALRGLLFVGLAGNLLLVLAECTRPHADTDSRAAAQVITRGRLNRIFWGGVVAGG